MAIRVARLRETVDFVFRERLQISFLLAAFAFAVLHSAWPFPEHNLVLALVRLRRPQVYQIFWVSYTTMLFTTPWILASLLLTTAYVFFYRPGTAKVRPVLPQFPDYSQAPEPMLVVGELHDARQPLPIARPSWLVLPARGLHTGIAIFGAIGSGKTSSCILPFLDQMLSYRAGAAEERIGGLVLEVKGDLCMHVKRLLQKAGREADYVEVGFDSCYRYNPLQNDLDPYALAYGIASLMNNLFGKGKEPFWQQAYTNMVKFLILLHKILYDYVTLFDIYECAISPRVLSCRIDDAEQMLNRTAFIEIPKATADELAPDGIERFGFAYDAERRALRAPSSEELKAFIAQHGIQEAIELVPKALTSAEQRKRLQLEAVARWFHDDWLAMDSKLRTSIVEGIAVFLSLFDDNPDVKRIFCPPKQLYTQGKIDSDPQARPLPAFASLIEQGKLCALNFPVALNPGLAKAIGTMMKLDYQRAVLLRIPQMQQAESLHPSRRFRDTVFVCDEYQHFATVGGNDPNGDEKFFSMSRQAKCIPIIATQSISSLKDTLTGDGWRTLLQTFRNKVFLTQADEFSIQAAATLCGKQDRIKLGYSLSESSSDARVSLLAGRMVSNKGSITASKSYSLQKDFIFDERSFTLLRNAQAIMISFDGMNPLEPVYVYLKPWYLDRNKSWWAQAADGEI